MVRGFTARRDRGEGMRSQLTAVLLALAVCSVATAQTPHAIHLDCPIQPLGDSTSILLREVIRQSFLLAARDECALDAADTSAGDSSRPGETVFSFRILSPSDEKKELLAALSEAGNDAVLARSSVTHHNTRAALMSAVELAERDSRETFPAVLASKGIVLAPPKWTDALPVPAPICSRMTKLDLVQQFQAARELHALIHQEGESPARLAALARVYANLFQLTRICLGPEPDVFAARALLYAQRVSLKAPKDKEALWSKVYVLTLVGLHADAGSAIVQADALAGDAPDFAAPVRAYLKFDPDGLTDTAVAPAVQPFAAYLDFLIVAPSRPEAYVAEKAERARLKNAFVQTLDDRLILTGSVGTVLTLAERAEHDTDTMLAVGLKEVPNASAELLAATKTLGASETPLLARRAIIDALLKDNAFADSPLTGQMLARIIRGITLQQSLRHAIAQSRMLARSIDEYVTSVLPVVQDDPFVCILEATRLIQLDGRAAAAKHLADVATLELRANTGVLDHLLWLTTDSALVSRAWKRSYSLSDGTAYDVENELFINHREATNSFQLAQAEWLGSISPGNPTGLAQRIHLDWPHLRDQLETIRPVALQHPTVALWTGGKLLDEERFEEAAVFYQMAIDRAEDVWSYTSKANAMLLAGHTAEYVELLTTCLESFPDDPGTHERLAYYYSLAGDPRTASIHAKAFARTGLEGSHRCEEIVFEQLGQWDDAEAIVRDFDVFPNDDEWLRWCIITGHGDRAAAFAEALPNAQAKVKKRDDRASRFALATLLLEGGDAAAAEEQYTLLWKRDGEPSSALSSAMLAIERHDDAARDAALLAATTTGVTARVEGRTRPTLIALANLIRAELGTDRIPLTLDAVDATVATNAAQVSSVYYLAGRYAELTDRPDLAKTLYARCLTRGARDNTPSALAADRLRASGIDPLPILWRSWEVQENVNALVRLLPWNRGPDAATLDLPPLKTK